MAEEFILSWDLENAVVALADDELDAYCGRQYFSKYQLRVAG